MPRKLMFVMSGLIALSIVAGRSSARAKGGPDVLWLSKYGYISWEAERSHLDNLAIQLMNEPNLIGYYYVRVGKESCRGEAQAHAVRAKNYLTMTRGVDWDRIIWRDIGYGEYFEVSIWLGDRVKGPMYVPDYKGATQEHVIKDCRVKSKPKSKGTKRGSSGRVQD